MNDKYSAESGQRLLQLWRYLALVLLPLAVVAVVLGQFPASGLTGAPANVSSQLGSLVARIDAPLPRFLMQLLVVLALAKVAGRMMKRLGQPPVIGEMVAGIMLGPSLFGWLLPEVQGWLFPAQSLAALGNISQLGVLVFMFAAGAELDISRMRGQRSLTLLVSHAGIALPFGLGIALAWPLHGLYAPEGVGYTGFALFIGIALSVTAFPVLLRILEERGYANKPIGMIAVACAAISDATAWAMLAVIVALVQSGNLAFVAISLTLALLFVWFVFTYARRRLANFTVDETGEPRWMIGMVLLILLCALFTEAIGLHALFGAFLAGVAISRSAGLRQLVENKIEPFAAVLLLPLFFASTGLRTRIDLLNGGEWLLCLGIVLVATVGKLGGTVLAARWSGMDKPDAWRLGALMNTRGLMELIVLGLGYDLGLIDQRLYAILVVVAIVTTVMTGPLLGLIDGVEARWRMRSATQPAAGSDSSRQ